LKVFWRAMLRLSACLGAAFLCAVAVACGGVQYPPAEPFVDPPGKAPASSTGPRLILRLMTVSITARGSDALRQIPDVSVYEGGLVIARQPGDHGPMLPRLPLVSLRISDGSVKQALERARGRAMTVKTAISLATPGLAGGDVTRFELTQRGRRHVARVSNITDADAEPRWRRREFLDFAILLRDIAAWSEKTEPPGSYTPTRAAVLSEEAPEGGQGGTQPEWSSSLGTPIKHFPRVTCSVLTGEEMARAEQALSSQRGPFRAPGSSKLVRVWIRPLLPDEATCEDLIKTTYGPQQAEEWKTPAHEG
jgi:hypothetical protein